MPKIYLYAELLVHIRTLSLHASLQTEKREGTKVDVSTDKRIITVSHDGETQQLYLPTQIKGDASVTFPLQKTTDISARIQIEDEHEWKCSISNEIEAPWMSSDLTSDTSIQCRHCHAIVLDSNKISQWKDLPSENWAELMDFWFCHKPHEDTTESAAEAKGFSSQSRLAVVPGTGMTDLISIVLHASDCTNVKASETQSNPSLTVLRCTQCTEMLGSTNLDEDLIRLHKSSIAVRRLSSEPFLSYPSSIFICAQLLSCIEATALKRFVVYSPQIEGKNVQPLELWVFNPDIYYSCSAYDGNARLTDAVTPQKTPDLNPNNDDVSRLYNDQPREQTNDDGGRTNDLAKHIMSTTSFEDNASQIYGESSGSRMVTGELEFEVPLRNKESTETPLTEIGIQSIEELETSFVAANDTSGTDTSAKTNGSTEAASGQQYVNLVHRASKIFYRPIPTDNTAHAFLDSNNATHEDLYLPNPADLKSLQETLEKSTAMLPASARAFQDWSVGLVHRYEKSPSGLGVMQENPLARGIKAKDGRVTRWDVGHGAQGLYD